MTHAIRPVDFDNLKTMTYEVTDRDFRDEKNGRCSMLGNRLPETRFSYDTAALFRGLPAPLQTL